MYMANHDIVLTADIATPTTWTRHQGPFAGRLHIPSLQVSFLQTRSLATLSLHRQVQPLKPVAVRVGVVRTRQVVLCYQYGLPAARILPLTVAAPVAL